MLSPEIEALAEASQGHAAVFAGADAHAIAAARQRLNDAFAAAHAVLTRRFGIRRHSAHRDIDARACQLLLEKLRAGKSAHNGHKLVAYYLWQRKAALKEWETWNVRQRAGEFAPEEPETPDRPPTWVTTIVAMARERYHSLRELDPDGSLLTGMVEGVAAHDYGAAHGIKPSTVRGTRRRLRLQLVLYTLADPSLLELVDDAAITDAGALLSASLARRPAPEPELLRAVMLGESPTDVATARGLRKTMVLALLEPAYRDLYAEISSADHRGKAMVLEALDYLWERVWRKQRDPV